MFAGCTTIGGTLTLIVWRFWVHRVGASLCVLAMAVVSYGASNAPVAAASVGRLIAKRQIVVRSLVVTKLRPSAQAFTVRATTATNGFRNVHVIAYTATTVFFGSPASDVKVGTKLTVMGSRTRARLTATKIRVNPSPTPSATTTTTTTTTTPAASTPTPSFGANGPFVGVKYVGNV
jgi:hypothetical protein